MSTNQLQNKKKVPLINTVEVLKNNDYNPNYIGEHPPSKLTISEKLKEEKVRKANINLFNYQQYYEKELIKKQIKELTELIKREIKNVEQTNKVLLTEIGDIVNLTINEQPEKPGLYHVRFFEIILNLLRQLRVKIGESKTWFNALISKKKKRGSLFVARSKKLGTQYSLSQEIQLTRSVQ